MAEKIILLCFLSITTLYNSQSIILQDSTKVNIPNSYYLIDADIFNSLYFYSKEENSIIKYNLDTENSCQLRNVNSSKMYIVSPLFIVLFDKVNKQLDFLDDKLIPTQNSITILKDKIINSNLIYIQDNKQLIYFDEFNTQSFISYDYRSHKDLLYSNSLDKSILNNFEAVSIYSYKQNKYLVLKSIPDNETFYKIVLLDRNNKISEIKIENIENYFWFKDQFIVQEKDKISIYNFKESPLKINFLETEKYIVIINNNIFLQDSKNYIYHYKININD